MPDIYRTYFDKDNGTYLGSYRGPDNGNPYTGHPSVEGQLDSFHHLLDGAPVREAPEHSYREKRKLAYVMELGASPGDFVETIGDVIDDLIREVRALAARPATPEFADLVAKVDAIKARFPKA
jgi:hypothetical protein